MDVCLVPTDTWKQMIHEALVGTTPVELEHVRHSLFYEELRHKCIPERIASHIMRKCPWLWNMTAQLRVTIVYDGHNHSRGVWIVQPVVFMSRILYAVETTVDRIQNLEQWPICVRRALLRSMDHPQVASALARLLDYDSSNTWMEQVVCLETLRYAQQHVGLLSAASARDRSKSTRMRLPLGENARVHVTSAAAAAVVGGSSAGAGAGTSRPVAHRASEYHPYQLTMAVFVCVLHAVRQTLLAQRDFQQECQPTPPVGSRGAVQEVAADTGLCRFCTSLDMPQPTVDSGAFTSAIMKRIADVLAGGHTMLARDVHSRCCWCRLVRIMAAIVCTLVHAPNASTQPLSSMVYVVHQAHLTLNMSRDPMDEPQQQQQQQRSSTLRTSWSTTIPDMQVVPLGYMIQQALVVFAQVWRMMQQCHTLDVRPTYMKLLHPRVQWRAQQRVPRLVTLLPCVTTPAHNTPTGLLQPAAQLPNTTTVHIVRDIHAVPLRGAAPLTRMSAWREHMHHALYMDVAHTCHVINAVTRKREPMTTAGGRSLGICDMLLHDQRHWNDAGAGERAATVSCVCERRSDDGCGGGGGGGGSSAGATAEHHRLQECHGGAPDRRAAADASIAVHAGTAAQRAAVDDASSASEQLVIVVHVSARARRMLLRMLWQTLGSPELLDMPVTERSGYTVDTCPMIAAPLHAAGLLMGDQWDIMAAMEWMYNQMFGYDHVQRPNTTASMLMHPMDPCLPYYRLLPLLLERVCDRPLGFHTLWRGITEPYNGDNGLFSRAPRIRVRRNGSSSSTRTAAFSDTLSMAPDTASAPGALYDECDADDEHHVHDDDNSHDPIERMHNRLQVESRGDSMPLWAPPALAASAHNCRIRILQEHGTYDAREHGYLRDDAYDKPVGVYAPGTAHYEPLVDVTEENDADAEDEQTEPVARATDLLQRIQEQQGGAVQDGNQRSFGAGLVYTEEIARLRSTQQRRVTVEDDTESYMAVDGGNDVVNMTVTCDSSRDDVSTHALSESGTRRRKKRPLEGTGDDRVYNLTNSTFYSNMLAFIAPYASRITVEHDVLTLCWTLLLSKECLWVRHRLLATLLIELMDARSLMHYRSKQHGDCPTWLVWRAMRMRYANLCVNRQHKPRAAAVTATATATATRAQRPGPRQHWVRETMDTGATQSPQHTDRHIHVDNVLPSPCKCTVCLNLSHTRAPPAALDAHHTSGFWRLPIAEHIDAFWDDMDHNYYVPPASYGQVTDMAKQVDDYNHVYHPLAVVPPYPADVDELRQWMEDHRPRVSFSRSKNALRRFGNDEHLVLPTRSRLLPTLYMPMHYLLYALACDGDVDADSGRRIFVGVRGDMWQQETRPPRPPNGADNMVVFTRSYAAARQWMHRAAAQVPRGCPPIPQSPLQQRKKHWRVQWLCREQLRALRADEFAQERYVGLRPLLTTMMGLEALRHLPYYEDETPQQVRLFGRSARGRRMRDYYGPGMTRATMDVASVSTMIDWTHVSRALSNTWYAGEQLHHDHHMLFPALFEAPTVRGDPDDVAPVHAEAVAMKDVMPVWDSPWTVQNTMPPAQRRSNPRMAGPLTHADQQMIQHALYHPLTHVCPAPDDAVTLARSAPHGGTTLETSASPSVLLRSSGSGALSSSSSSTNGGSPMSDTGIPPALFVYRHQRAKRPRDQEHEQEAMTEFSAKHQKPHGTTDSYEWLQCSTAYVERRSRYMVLNAVI